MKSNIRIISILIALTGLICAGYGFLNGNITGPHPYEFKYPGAYGAPHIPADNPLTKEGVWLGKLLFYDPILSVNGKISCAGCHKQNLSFTDGLPLAVGVHGDTLKRNTMALINLAWGKHFFWDGRDSSLELVVKDHIKNPLEMGGINEKELNRRLKAHAHYPALFSKAFPQDSISLNTVSKAVAQFTRTIVAQLKREDTMPEKFKPEGNGNTSSIDELRKENSLLGSTVRVSLMKCKSCHTTEALGGQLVTKNENDSAFKAPVLMNIKYTGPYMHDGRFRTMKEVFQFYNENLISIFAKNPNIRIDRADIPKFNDYDLEHADEIFSNFEDHTIMTNPLFSDPFVQKDFNWLDTNNEAPNK